MKPLPPHQQLVARDKWPLVGEKAPAPHDGPWTLTVAGEVRMPRIYTLAELQTLPTIECAVDLHCVTRWSKLGVRFTGVRLVDLVAASEPTSAARFVSFVAHSLRQHSSSLVWNEARDLDPLVVWAVDDQPLSVDHGGPLRVIVPGRYLYKSVKWLSRIELLPDDRLGFWEATAGYHNHADPWHEQRYMASDLNKQQIEALLSARDWSNRELRSLVAAGRDLAKLNAVGAILRDADLSDCRLIDADFSRANLSNARLCRANLQRVDFRQADCEGADFSGSDLRGARFGGASLFGGSFRAADGTAAVVDHTTEFPAAIQTQLTPCQLAWLAGVEHRVSAE